MFARLDVGINPKIYFIGWKLFFLTISKGNKVDRRYCRGHKIIS